MFTGHWIRSFSLLGMMLGLPTLAACGANPSPGELATAPTGKVVSALTAPNLALGKPATQSSTAYGADASRAVDGNTDGNFFNNSVTHTADSGWWQVDLGSAQRVGNVVLWNRTDCCSERLQNFALLVSPNGTDWTSFPNPGTAGPQVSFAVNGLFRYVKVQANSGTYPLSLAEVQVLPMTAYGRGVGTVPSSGCGAGQDMDGGLCYPKCASGYHGVGPVCWPDATSYGRGAGTVPKSCGAGQDMDGGLCYPSCASGYHGVGPVCWQLCPDGYTDTGAFCERYAQTIDSNHGSCPWYDVCGLTFAKGCSSCPPGYNNTGCTCTIPDDTFAKKSSGRGVGTPPTTCGAGQDLDGGLCYSQCASGFHGVGPVCWPNATSYGRGVGSIPTSSCAAGHDLDAGLCYPSCDGGYHGMGPFCYSDALKGQEVIGSVCDALYLPAAAQLAISSGKALTFGLGAGIAAGGAAGVETGVAYGPGGEYGCYISTCEGVVTAVSISAWASVGAWNSFNSVSGNSVVVAGGLSTDLVDGLPVGVGAAVGLVSTDGGHPLPIGITASASLGAGLSAFVVLSAEACQTAVTKVR